MSFFLTRSPSTKTLISLLFFFFFFFGHSVARQQSPNQTNPTDLVSEGSITNVTYHMGPVFTSPITVHIIWYGNWPVIHKQIIREFLNSISAPKHQSPSVSDWWKIVRLYTDQTGSNVSGTVRLGKETNDRFMSQGRNLTGLSLQSVMKTALNAETNPLPVDSTGGIYLVLTADDVHVENFCNSVCGFRNFTYPTIVGYLLPYIFVGNPAKLCPVVCAYPFAVMHNIPGLKPLISPNGNVGIDGMISTISRMIANLVTNPLYNSWYDDQDHPFDLQIADLCEGVYGIGAGGKYAGKVFYAGDGGAYNAHGIQRRFMVPWVWNHVTQRCDGPNAVA